MPSYSYMLLDVFTDRPFGGNQLAVFPDARGLDSATMQRLAAELNLAETTFVLPPRDPANDYQVRIFHSRAEMPMAGHPTLGTAYVLAAREPGKALLRFEEIVGMIPVRITYDGAVPAFIQMEQPPPTFGTTFARPEIIAQMLSLPLDALDPHLPVEVVSTGVPYLIVPLTSLSAVRDLRFRHDVWAREVAAFSPASIFVFAMETETVGATTHCRMFSTDEGGIEDAATGSANGPLGCYLARHGLIARQPTVSIVSEQGFEMGRPSLIHIEIGRDGDLITAVRVGGSCVPMGEGMFRL